MQKNSPPPPEVAEEIVSDELEGAQDTMIKDTDNRPSAISATREEKGRETGTHKGTVLKKARLERGLSLEAVHEATKIPMDALRAIEDGYTVRTLSGFYYKGFLKIYARYLDVDIAQVLDEHKEEQIVTRPPPPEPKIEFNYSLSRILTKKRQQQLLLFLGSVLALVVLFNIIRAAVHFMSSRMSRPKAAMREEKSPNRTTNVNDNISQSMDKAQAKPASVVRNESKSNQSSSMDEGIQEKRISLRTVPVIAAPAVQEKAVTLTARAQKNSWLRVKADGAIVFQATLRQGAVETWTANKLIEISGRNIHELEFELNGKTIGSLGREDRKAKRLEVTKDGLKVTR